MVVSSTSRCRALTSWPSSSMTRRSRSPTLTAPVTLDPTTIASASASATALAAFRAGALDGAPGIAAGREAALAVLGRSKAEGDGWADEEDMDEVIEEEGSRARRRALPNGRLVSCK
eukprot:7387219-Prymnesium_polylepis.1